MPKRAAIAGGPSSGSSRCASSQALIRPRSWVCAAGSALFVSRLAATRCRVVSAAAGKRYGCAMIVRNVTGGSICCEYETVCCPRCRVERTKKRSSRNDERGSIAVIGHIRVGEQRWPYARVKFQIGDLDFAYRLGDFSNRRPDADSFEQALRRSR